MLENKAADFSETLARETKASHINRQLIVSWQINKPTNFLKRIIGLLEYNTMRELNVNEMAHVAGGFDLTVNPTAGFNNGVVSVLKQISTTAKDVCAPGTGVGSISINLGNSVAGKGDLNLGPADVGGEGSTTNVESIIINCQGNGNKKDGGDAGDAGDAGDGGE